MDIDINAAAGICARTAIRGTEGKLADGAITSAKIANGTIEWRARPATVGRDHVAETGGSMSRAEASATLVGIAGNIGHLEDRP